jgi:ABC-type bacteriocin/lantibiotic exporter with double-glycine peptidase domain
MNLSTLRLVGFLLFFGALFAAEPPGVWLDVPFVKQETNGCGAAAIAMVMQYWHRQQGSIPSVSPEEIERALYSRPAHGIYASAMELYFQEHGFRTFAFRGEWEDLKEHLEKGRPLVVALSAGHGNFHYALVAGLNWQEGVVLENDPAERKLLKQDRSNFEREWKAAGNWTLLAVPQQGERLSSQ